MPLSSLAVKVFGGLPSDRPTERSSCWMRSAYPARFCRSMPRAQSSLELQHTWKVFVSPVASIVFLQDPRIGRLNASLASISANCTTAFVPIDDSNSSILTIVGSHSPLEKLCIRRDEVLVLYQSGLARLWDAVSGELRRSINRATATSLLSDQEDEWWQL